MRDTIFTTLLLASATVASASRLECLHTRSRELATAASCGDEGSLSYCLSHLATSTAPEALSQELERCFHSAGCTSAEAQTEALWALRRCDAPQSDLRRGRRQAPDVVGAVLAAVAAKEPLLAARTPLPQPAGIAAMNVPRQATTTTTDPAAGSSPSPCFTDSTAVITTCPIQTTGQAGRRMTCFPTTITTAVCREGLICRSDDQGNPSCMYKQTSLGIDGIIIAVIFATAIAVSVISICTLCCRERRAHQHAERAARIANEAKTEAAVAAKRPGPNVTAAAASTVVEGQPLMYQGAPAAAAAATAADGSPPAHQQDFAQQPQPGSGGYGAANPFADAQDGHPLR